MKSLLLIVIAVLLVYFLFPPLLFLGELFLENIVYIFKEKADEWKELFLRFK